MTVGVGRESAAKKKILTLLGLALLCYPPPVFFR